MASWTKWYYKFNEEFFYIVFSIILRKVYFRRINHVETNALEEINVTFPGLSEFVTVLTSGTTVHVNWTWSQCRLGQSSLTTCVAGSLEVPLCVLAMKLFFFESSIMTNYCKVKQIILHQDFIWHAIHSFHLRGSPVRILTLWHTW